MSKFNVGDKVRYIGEDHDDMPKFYPPVGTIGTVIKQLNEYDDIYVQWEKGSTSKEDCWHCGKHDIELVKDTDMTNEEIWEMLRPKMEKNSLKSVASIIHTSTDKDCSKFNLTHVYAEDDVHNAIALAYKVGYLRAMKGRPFKFGEKKKKNGHWEPVDPNNLPKEGTKVRYSRFCEYHPAIPVANKVLSINSIGTVLYKYKKFGVEVDNSWHCCPRYPERFDMWVEDDE